MARKYGWAVFYDRFDSKLTTTVGLHMTLMQGSSIPICGNLMKFGHWVRKNALPEEGQRCVACVRLHIMRELSE